MEAVRPPFRVFSKIARVFAAAVREPLFHFLLLGLALYAATAFFDATARNERIVVTDARVAKLAADYQRQFGAPPSAQTLEELISQYIEDEIFYRSGRTLGLHHDDEIIRRRVVQKMRFLQLDLNAPAEPTQEELAAFFRTNIQTYAIPERVTFSHIYFSPDIDGIDAAKERALTALKGLDAGAIRAPERGDNFPFAFDYAGIDPTQARRMFGEGELAESVFSVPTGRWAGPFQSGYGWHLTRVSMRLPQQEPPLKEVYDRVREDFLASGRELANRQIIEKLKRRFIIIREGKAP